MNRLVARLGRPTTAVLVYYVLYVASYLWLPLSEDAWIVWTDLAYLPLNVASIVLALRVVGLRLLERRSRVAWSFVAGSMVFQAWGDTAWTYLEVLRGGVPDVSVADLGYGVMYPLMFVGLLLLPQRRWGWRPSLILTLDAATVVGAGFMVIWTVSLGSAVEEGIDSLAGVLAVAYPVGDLLLVLGLVTVALRGAATANRGAMVALLAGLVCLIVSDTAYAYLDAHGGDTRWVDLTWIAALGLFAVSADQYRRAALREARRPQSPLASVMSDIRPPARLPYVAVLASYAVVAHAALNVPLFPLGGLLLGSVGVTIAVVARQLFSAGEYAALAERYRHAATTDDLTGLLTRRHFFELAEQRLALDARAGQPSTLMVIDVDRFKRINDSYGHLAGDAVLREIADRCRATVRAGDLLGRYGGDELLVLLPGMGAAEAQPVAERMVEVVAAEPVRTLGHAIEVTLSIGHTTTDGEVGLQALIGRADSALYGVKDGGRGGAAGTVATVDPERP
ncbi:GGDEF domain-containing protein [Sanguibacter sp. 25GB23B1]|uniref:GGDEF domain-containing protein n=1 Tax=unclassified Sanguibacter TaxID=2645534 RepID=UPI0032B007C8